MSQLRITVVCLLALVSVVLAFRFTKPISNDTLQLGPEFISPKSWHLTGWKSIDGKKVPWEIWGQLNPPFSYERLGESRRWTQNKQDYFLTPPIKDYPSVLLKNLPATPINRLALLQPWGVGEIDPATKLHQHYKTPDEAKNQSESELKAEYNIALPDQIKTISVNSTPAIDMKEPLRPIATTPNTFSGEGITLKGRFVSQDDEGNLRIDLEAVVGQPGSSIRLPFTIHQISPMGPKRFSFSDNLKNQYIYTTGKSLLQQKDRPASEFFFIVVNPLTEKSMQQKTINLPITININLISELTKYYRPSEDSLDCPPIDLVLSETLPKIIPNFKQYQTICELRFSYYLGLSHQNNFSRAEKIDLEKKAAFWIDKVRQFEQNVSGG
jgi:hypothetical protein